VLANEQVSSSGTCWRGHSGVYKRALEQWYFRITAYADELLADLEKLDWPEHILAMQRNWIGRSQGVEFEIEVAGHDTRFQVYTTRPDPIYGMTFAVLAPEHPLLEQIVTPKQRSAVSAYRQAAMRRSELDRLQQADQPAESTGVFTGAYAINPVNGIAVPIYVADYVLMGYGSGAVMAVPAHDARDYAFAAGHDIPIVTVVSPPGWSGEPLSAAYTDPGTMTHSGPWDGRPSEEAGEGIADWLQARGIGRRAVQYRMRDWLISRQRYWGAPIPIVYCARCGTVSVPEQDLPVLLPHIEAWLPGQDGRSPLANVPDFVHTTCPRCGEPARRETDTLDGFACSSWYFLRFTSPHYQQGPFDPAALAQWGPPDLYVGGAEHAVMHLLYARFWTKVMADAGIISFREPFPVLRSQGVMHARDPESGQIRRMSKSTGNVVTPDDVAQEYGADSLRIYLLFMAPFENHTVWEKEGIVGARRFLQRVWRLVNLVTTEMQRIPAGPDPDGTPLVAQTTRAVRQVTSDLEAMKFNTAIATLMEYLNELFIYHRRRGITHSLVQAVRTLVLLLAPFAPHIAEELWARLGGAYSVHQQAWPVCEDQGETRETVTLIVQVDGKVRDRLTLPAGVSEAEVRIRASDSPGARRHLRGRRIVRTVYVPGRLVNVVTVPSGEGETHGRT
jgi:leucyl-tRNA synthetase